MQIAALAVTAVLCAAVIRRGAPEAALAAVRRTLRHLQK